MPATKPFDRVRSPLQCRSPFRALDDGSAHHPAGFTQFNKARTPCDRYPSDTTSQAGGWTCRDMSNEEVISITQSLFGV